jgi:hypothetical protein
MPADIARECFIPLRKSELVDLLCSDEALSQADQGLFRRFCAVVSATYHVQFNQRLETLKSDYAPFDPDSDTPSLAALTSLEKQRRLNQLLREFAWLLERADFKHLTREEIEPGRGKASQLGFHLFVDWSCFEHVAIFARGEASRATTIRRLRNFFRKEKIAVPIFQRLALILKLKPDRRFGPNVNTSCVYLKIFKEIPRLDVKSLLPTARVRLSPFERGKIGFSLMGGIGLALWKILQQVAELSINFLTDVLPGALLSPLALWGIASATAGYGYRSYYNYTHTKQNHNLTLTQSLYYQNLDSNAGVLFRLLDEAEEQQCREAFLAYFLLWRHAPEEGWNIPELEGQVERYLEGHAQLKVAFDIGAALEKLEKLGVARKSEDRYSALPIQPALDSMSRAWQDHLATVR